jgi:hypothetical protein
MLSLGSGGHSLRNTSVTETSYPVEPGFCHIALPRTWDTFQALSLHKGDTGYKLPNQIHPGVTFYETSTDITNRRCPGVLIWEL